MFFPAKAPGPSLARVFDNFNTKVEATQVVRGFFVFGQALGVILNSVPYLKQRFLDYGPRAAAPATRDPQQLSAEKDSKPSVEKKLSEENLSEANVLDRFLGHKVPHRYFLHYYVVSVVCSLFWGYQILVQGSVLRAASPKPSFQANASNMQIQQVLIVWAMMAVQGCRRLIETMLYMKPTASKMPVLVYLSGIAYYFIVNIAVWIEGSDAVLTTDSIVDCIGFRGVLSLRTMLFFPVFLMASGIQNDCHRYLASLPKYTLPVLFPFQYILCPHYTMECLIYLSMAIIGAPHGKWINQTLLTVVIFAGINLGFIANETKQWSAKKFGADKVDGRWIMIPGFW